MPNKQNDPLMGSLDGVQIPDGAPCVFVIYKQGYFGHGVHGIARLQRGAVRLADNAAARDIDSYHSYDVYPVPLGLLPNIGEDHLKDYGWMNQDPSYSTTKENVINPQPTQESLGDTDTLYLVYKQGRLYGHGIHGVETSAERAITLAKLAATQDKDDYHAYDVYTLPVNLLPDTQELPRENYGWMEEDPIFSINKEDAGD
jgi:hypothetical protein